MRLNRRDWLRVALVLVGGTLINIWGLSWIPFHRLHLTAFWGAILFRGCATLVSLLLIRLICPGALRRFGWGGRPKELGISLLIVAVLVGPMLMQTDYHGAGIGAIIESFIFALCIGIDEDFFSRGFMYGALERYGIWFAAILSSLQFGLSHLGNIVWGGQSAVYTIAQAISAGAFGLLAVALMIYSGSIWIPILLHGLNDFPMQFESSHQYVAVVTGGADWVGVGVDVVIYCSIAWVLIRLSDSKKNHRLRTFSMILKISD